MYNLYQQKQVKSGEKMSKKDFDDYLKKLETTDDESEIDWAKQKEEWLMNLTLFYQMIENYLREYKSLIFEYNKININEEYIGTYEADSMTIKFRGNKVNFYPIGTNLIGSKGRVDMEGSASKIRFVLVDKNTTGPTVVSQILPCESAEVESHETEWVWKIATHPPSIKFVELNQDTFFDALMEVING